MLSTILASSSSSITVAQFLICTLVSLILGCACAAIYMFRNRYSKSFVITLVLMPAIVQMVIMLVNGNIGTGLAVAGTFSLVRYRSLPGSAREIGSVFLAVAVGLATGSGYLGIAALFVVIMGAASILLVTSGFGEPKKGAYDMKIAIPETLEYSGFFDDIFKKYTQQVSLMGVKTIEMGSLYELYYTIQLKSGADEKAFLDEVRTKNGNLPVRLNTVGTREDML